MGKKKSALQNRLRLVKVPTMAYLDPEQAAGRFIAVDQSFYGCASLKQGGLAACTNTARLRRVTLEQRILAEIEAEILADEALERVKRERTELVFHASRDQR